LKKGKRKKNGISIDEPNSGMVEQNEGEITPQK
jgi:hypothetical protein